MHNPVIEKVLIYAIACRGLLVFDEPDFPDCPVQVPGGTVDVGETLDAAARREFKEETGLRTQPTFQHLITLDHCFKRNGAIFTHRRSYFSVALPDDLPETWCNHEATPHDGGTPILFRFFWLSLSSARKRLGLGMAECLDYLA